MTTVLGVSQRPETAPPEVTTDELALQGLASLTTLIRDCAASGMQRQAALFRAELLPHRRSRPHHRRLARAALDPLLRAERAAWHDLPGGAVAISWRGDASLHLAAATAQLQHLLADATDMPPMADLLRVFTLPTGGPALLHLMAPTAADPAPPGPRPGSILEAASLAVLERDLATVDVARFVRRMAVCRIADADMTLAWEKRYLSVTELAATLMPGASMTAIPWLYRRLTRVMDVRMLALLTNPAELAAAGPFSLDLNVASVLSPEFLRFDAALPVGLRGRVTLNVAAEDLAADLPAFAFARDFCRARGYRFLLRGVTSETLGFWRLDQLNVDAVELRWSPALSDLSLSDLSLAGMRLGRAEWVLAHVDDPAALAWGRQQGVGLFQGRAIVAPRRRPEVSRTPQNR